MVGDKKFPENVKALHMVVQALLRSIIFKEPSANFDELMELLEEKARLSKSVKILVDNHIKPIFIMMKFIWAESEGDWTFHLAAFRDMFPYCCVAGHINYTRYGHYYLHALESFLLIVLSHFLKGNLVLM